MTEQRMTLVERLRNPAWKIYEQAVTMSLNVEQTRDTMDEAADVIADLLAALECARGRLQTAHEHILAHSKQATKSTILPIIRYGIDKADAAIAKASGGTP